MGSLNKLKECVIPHVPEDRRDEAGSALDVMTDLCAWIDGGPLALNPRINAKAMLASCSAIFGTDEELYVSRNIAESPPDLEPVAYDAPLALERLYRSFPRHNVRNMLAEAIPWSINAAIWEHLKGRIDAGVPEEAKATSVNERAAAERMIRDLTLTYILAVLGDDVRAITMLKPLLHVMPHMVPVGVASVPGHKTPMTTFVFL